MNAQEGCLVDYKTAVPACTVMKRMHFVQRLSWQRLSGPAPEDNHSLCAAFVACELRANWHKRVPTGKTLQKSKWLVSLKCSSRRCAPFVDVQAVAF